MRGVFLDTVGILALLERSDQWHAAASAAFRALRLSGAPLHTTSLVFLECGNALARKPSRRRLAEIRAEFTADGTLVDSYDDEIEAAWAAYARGEAGDAGIIDHVSFAVMRRLGLTRAFTNDAHFRAAGFETLF